MPKTKKNAFALRDICDNIACQSYDYPDCDGRGYLPTYAERVDENNENFGAYFGSSDGQIEEILWSYLIRGEIKHESDNTLSGFEKAYDRLKILNRQIARAQKIAEWIGNHVVRLQSYEKKLLDSILKSGLTDDLKNKGYRVKKYLADYCWLVELFAGYEEKILIKDREKLRVIVNRLYRKEFGSRLRQARVASNLTIEEVANKINLTRVGYGYYELGRRDPPPGAIYIFAKMFNVSADWLLGLK